MRTKHRVQRPTFKSFSTLIVGLLILSLGTTHPVMAADGPDLVILMENTGNFIEGGSGTYTITVSNDGNQPTNGNQISVGIFIDGNYLEATTLSGTGWNCDIDNLTCVRSDVLNGSGASYPQITLTVNIADETPNTVGSDADVSGGGEPAGNVTDNNSSFDTALVTQVANLTVIKSHVEDSVIVDDGFGNITTYDFAEGDQDRTYTIVVENVGDGSTDGTTITVTEVLPTGLTNGSLSGNGWNCSSLTCTRSDILPAGEVYPPLTLTVDVAVDAPEELTNIVNVSGGGDLDTSNNSDSDPTRIRPLADLEITGYQFVDTTLEHNPLPSSPQANQPFAIKIFVKNQGGADMPPFYRSVYFENHFQELQTNSEGCLYSTDPNETDLGDYYPENLFGGVPAGTSDGGLVSVNIEKKDPSTGVIISSGLPEGTHKLYLYADPSCLGEKESNETNNWFGPITINTVASKKSFLSVGAQDGWILESSETSNTGKKLNKGSSLLYVGDDASDRQYISILSFNTASIPDNAVITKVTLKFKYAGFTGTIPFSTHGNLLVDVRKGLFSNNANLQPGDFKTSASKSQVLVYNKNKVGNWYSRTFSLDELKYINKLGITQFRLRFTKDDNNDNGADFLKIYSGNVAASGNRPKLIIEYYVP